MINASGLVQDSTCLGKQATGNQLQIFYISTYK